MPNCHKCGRELSADTEYGRQDSCPGCRASTHCCLNCLHYDTSKYNECAEPNADRVVDKEKANFCDYFKPCDTKARGAKAGDARSAALKAAESLFKKR